MQQKSSPYDQLHALSKEIASFQSTLSLLEWDQETYMPELAISHRARQISQLASYIHKQSTSSRYRKLLSQMINIESGTITNNSLSLPQQVAARRWRRSYLQSKKLPSSFVRRFSNLCAEAIHTWTKARKAQSFALFQPALEKIVALCRKKADILGYQHHPYDALLDLYEPDMTVGILSPLFEQLAQQLVPMVKTIAQRPKREPLFLTKEFDPAKQLQFSWSLLQAMGFTSNSSRLDQSTHPFCTGLHPTDTRMTTRIYLHNPLSNIFSTLHEGGHGLYNCNLPQESYGSPLGMQISLGMDESQSRWWENWIGKSHPFWTHFFPELKKTFPHQLQDTSIEEFYQVVTQVQPSFIRVEADEVTYSLHIILRFQIEQQLIAGTLAVKDLPDAWNSRMQQLFGISPDNDSVGCLQDIHWSMGGFGYFPTYALGNLYAAQLFIAFEKDHPKWADFVARGELAFITHWLKEKIHRWGQQFTAQELIHNISGQPLSVEPFLTYLKNKYSF